MEIAICYDLYFEQALNGKHESMRNIFICWMFLKILGLKLKCMYYVSDPYGTSEKIVVKLFERFTKIVKKQKIY